MSLIIKLSTTLFTIFDSCTCEEQALNIFRMGGGAVGVGSSPASFSSVTSRNVTIRPQNF